MTFGVALLTMGAGLVLFAATINLEALEKTGESRTLFELIHTEFGWRGWVLMAGGAVMFVLGYFHFMKKIENLK